MKIIKRFVAVDREKLVDLIKNTDWVNQSFRFDEKKGRPTFKVRERNHRIRISCEMVGGATKDNGFISGTFFSGRIIERDDGVVLKGVIVTAPLYHALLALLTAFFIYRCIQLQGINFVPIIMMVFSFIMFKDEFKKQNLIAAFLSKAIATAEK